MGKYGLMSATLVVTFGAMFAPVDAHAYTSGGYVSSFTVSDIKATELGGNSYKDPIALDANGGLGGPSLQFGSKWYEAIVKGEGVTLVGWKDFWMGGNVAIPVTVTDGDGNNYRLLSENITIEPGTYIDYGTPGILTESEMWWTYGQRMWELYVANDLRLEKDGGVWVYNTWDWEERFAYSCELEKGIWPFFESYSAYDDAINWIEAHPDRQWIVIPTGSRPQKGTHTFTVCVKVGGTTANFPVSFTMSPDQKATAATVRFNANGGKVDEYGRVVNLNVAIGTLPVPERNGYTFKGWYTAKTKGTKASSSTKVTKAMTLYAQWTPKKYWVYEDSDNKKTGTIDTGSGTKMSGMGKYAVGSKVTIKVVPINKNYVFREWDWGGPDNIIPKKWSASPMGSEYTTITFTMPAEDVQIGGYGMKKSEDYAPRFTIDCGSVWYVEDQDEVMISIDSGSFPKLNTNKTIPSGMKLVRVAECEFGYQCQYVLKVSDWSKLPKGTIKTVKLTATNRSGGKTTKSFKVIMPNKTQAVEKGVLDMETSATSPYELEAGMKFSWDDLGIDAAEGWKITAITGIPGLKWDAAKQKMTGVPSKDGTYAATFTVARGGTKYTATATFNVEALPKEVVGTFYGYCTPPKIYDSIDDYDNDGNPYAFGKMSRKVTVSVASSGKVTAKMGSVTLSGTGLATDENGNYGINLSSSKKYKTYTDVKQLELAIKPDAGFAEDALTGIFGYGKVTPMTGALAEEKVFARKNAAATDAEANTIASKYAKLGKQSFIVFKAYSGSGYSYDLACPACVMQPSKKAEVFVKIDKNGKATLSGKIGGVNVSGTSYLSYECPDEESDTLKVYARFVSGKFVIEIVGDTEYFYSNGSLNGRVWKK